MQEEQEIAHHVRFSVWYSDSDGDFYDTVGHIMHPELDEPPKTELEEGIRGFLSMLGSADINYPFWVRFE